MTTLVVAVSTAAVLYPLTRRAAGPWTWTAVGFTAISATAVAGHPLTFAASVGVLVAACAPIVEWGYTHGLRHAQVES